MRAKIQSPKSKIAACLAMAACFFVFLPSASACVGCREAGSFTMAHESSTVLAGVGFSWSVVFMLAFVLCVVAGMSCYIWRTCQRIERDRVGG